MLVKTILETVNIARKQDFNIKLLYREIDKSRNWCNQSPLQVELQTVSSVQEDFVLHIW